MWDSNLLFHDGAALTVTGDSASIDLGKTAGDGVWVEIAVSAVTGTAPTMDFIVAESDNDSSYNNVVTFPQLSATGRWFRKVQSKKRYLRLSRTSGGTSPSFTVTAGIVSYPLIDAAA